GCGSAGHARAGASTRQAPRVLLKGLGVPAAAVAVIKGWADALRTGHPQLAAAYWALPSAMVNGTDTAGQLAVVQIRTSRDALAADETLPCGATLQSTRLKGALVEALFTLGTRVGATSAAGCSGPAAVDFLIRDRHIVRWLRAPTSPSPSPGTPQSAPALRSVRAQPAPSGRSSNST
ncbi:MAG TPA: hypothetical protein VII03_00490, partial [Solirubrobacteraceae bacterium]